MCRILSREEVNRRRFGFSLFEPLFFNWRMPPREAGRPVPLVYRKDKLRRNIPLVHGAKAAAPESAPLTASVAERLASGYVEGKSFYVAVVGDSKTGKTSFVDYWVAQTHGSGQGVWSAEPASRYTDSHPLERGREMSIFANLFTAPLDAGATCTFVDLPGHSDFIAATLEMLPSVENVLLVVDPLIGFTETSRLLLTEASKGALFVLLLINKLDLISRAGAPRVLEILAEASQVAGRSFDFSQGNVLLGCTRYGHVFTPHDISRGHRAGDCSAVADLSAFMDMFCECTDMPSESTRRRMKSFVWKNYSKSLRNGSKGAAANALLRLALKQGSKEASLEGFLQTRLRPPARSAASMQTATCAFLGFIPQGDTKVLGLVRVLSGAPRRGGDLLLSSGGEAKQLSAREMCMVQGRYTIPIERASPGNIVGIEASLGGEAELGGARSSPWASPLIRVVAKISSEAALGELVRAKRLFPSIAITAMGCGVCAIDGTGELSLDSFLHVALKECRGQVEVEPPTAVFRETCGAKARLYAKVEAGPDVHLDLECYPLAARDLPPPRRMGGPGRKKRRVRAGDDPLEEGECRESPLFDDGSLAQVRLGREDRPGLEGIIAVLGGCILRNGLKKEKGALLERIVPELIDGFRRFVRGGPLCGEQVVYVSFTVKDIEMEESRKRGMLERRWSGDLKEGFKRALGKCFYLASPLLAEPWFSMEAIVPFSRAMFREDAFQRIDRRLRGKTLESVVKKFVKLHRGKLVGLSFNGQGILSIAYHVPSIEYLGLFSELVSVFGDVLLLKPHYYYRSAKRGAAPSGPVEKMRRLRGII